MKKTATVEYIKSLGKNKNSENLKHLLSLFENNYEITIKREIVSSIGRQKDNKLIHNFISKNAFKDLPMELIYQMYRTCLYKGKNDKSFVKLGEKIRLFYKNEMINKMHYFYFYKNKKTSVTKVKLEPTLLIGDARKTLGSLPSKSVHMIFTSPPYYNAREYSDYHSYNEYLNKMNGVFKACHRVLEDGRFLIVNVSPVISKRPGREFESIRYPIHFDLHRVLSKIGFEFIDEIIWIKPEPSVPNRIGGFIQNKTPLAYKPNCVTESVIVYRKKSNILIDEIIKSANCRQKIDKKVFTTNCWHISPKSSKLHPAIFPEQLCEHVLTCYSFPGDVVLDPFAGIGTLGTVAKKLKRVPILCEINAQYCNEIIKKDKNYDIWRTNS